MSTELRKRVRRTVNADITLVDDLTGKSLGNLVNIHQEGMMLITHAQVMEDNIYQVTLQQTLPDQQIVKINLGLDCIWRRELEQGNGCWAGFRIISASDEALVAIEKLILQFASESGDDPALKPA